LNKILRLHHLVIVAALSMIIMPSSTLNAQENQFGCRESFNRLMELYNKDMQQLNEVETKPPAYESDQKLWDEHEKLWTEHLRQDKLEFNQVVDAGRKHLSGCSEWDSNKEMVMALDIIASGLSTLGEFEDAVPILKRCLALEHDSMTCQYALGEAYFGLCRYDDAKEADMRVIAIGGFTEENAKHIEMAKSQLTIIDHIVHGPKQRASWHDLYQCPSEDSSEQASATRFGSGFFVSKQGYILTNNHVVEGCKKLTISDEKTLTMVDRRPLVDLALLKVDATPPNVAIFRSGPPPKAGDTVFAFGFPLPDILSSEGNISTGILSAIAGVNNNVQLVQISAPVQPGNSGGPLLDSDGHIIGVVVAKLDSLAIARLTGDMPQNINFAVHWAEVKAFLDEEKVEYLSAPSTGQVKASLIADRAKQFSVRIECTE
jgi:S1-C subfamily serine protease